MGPRMAPMPHTFVASRRSRGVPLKRARFFLTDASDGVTCPDILTAGGPVTVNFRPGIPRYLQIAEALRRDLRGEGERIASEHQLCARFGVSRPTVRQALDVLVQEGRLYRHAGRGTFATASAGNDRRLRVIGSIDDMISLGGETWFKQIGREMAPVPANIAPALRLPPGSSAYRVSR